MSILRRISATAAALAVAIATLITVSSSPAYAHSRSSAVYNGCGSGYSVVSDGIRKMHDDPGRLVGEVLLTYNSSNGRNCVVTYKPIDSPWHGVKTQMYAAIHVRGQANWASNRCACYHWESVTRYARGKCVKYQGYIMNPYGIMYVAGRTTWGNCG